MPGWTAMPGLRKSPRVCRWVSRGTWVACMVGARVVGGSSSFNRISFWLSAESCSEACFSWLKTAAEDLRK